MGEAKPEEEEEGEEGFMADRRVVEREMDQDGERNGGDLRMTLKNDLVSERIVRRKEDVEEKNQDKDERRIVVKDEKEVVERRVRREQDRQREEERRIRKEEEKRRDQKRRSERSEEGRSRGGDKDRGDNRDKSREKKPERKVSEVPLDNNDEEKAKKVEGTDTKITETVQPVSEIAASEDKEKSKVDTKVEAK